MIPGLIPDEAQMPCPSPTQETRGRMIDLEDGYINPLNFNKLFLWNKTYLRKIFHFINDLHLIS